jgi:hypothetical protein
MSKMLAVVAQMFEEQAALMQRHANALKAMADGHVGDEVIHVDAPKKKVKAPKDPNRPKRPLSGYQIFMADNNAQFKEKNPEANATVIMSEVAKAWSTLGEDKKSTYLAKAEKLKDVYLGEMAEYNAHKHERDDSEEVIFEKKVPKVKAAASSSSSAAAPAAKKAAPAAATASAAPAAAAETSKKSEEHEKHHEKHHKKHHRSESVDSSEAGGETDKKKKVSILVYSGRNTHLCSHFLALVVLEAQKEQGLSRSLDVGPQGRRKLIHPSLCMRDETLWRCIFYFCAVLSCSRFENTVVQHQ